MAEKEECLPQDFKIQMRLITKIWQVPHIGKKKLNNNFVSYFWMLVVRTWLI